MLIQICVVTAVKRRTLELDEEEEEEEDEEEEEEELPEIDPQILKRRKMIEDYKVVMFIYWTW